MNETPFNPNVESPATQEASKQTSQGMRPVLIWDVPVRLVHWLMALSFTGAYLTSEADDWRWLHVSLGYTMMGLIVFRALWGFIGSRHARFTSFIKGPTEVFAYLKSLVSGRAQHYAGHNPAGAIAILALLILGFIQTSTGHLLYQDLAGEWMEEVHEALAAVLLGVVLVHIAGVFISSHLHRENLIKAMFTGRKRADQKVAIHSHWRSIGLLVLLMISAFWIYQLQDQLQHQSKNTANDGKTATTESHATTKQGKHEDDDD